MKEMTTRQNREPGSFTFIQPNAWRHYNTGEFDTPTEAIVACQKIVDANIESITENETDSDKAYESYVCFGDDPWIEGVEFSASEYAKIKIKEMLKGQNKYPVTVLRARGGF